MVARSCMGIETRSPSHVRDVIQAGSHGGAALGGILGKADPKDEVEAYLGALRSTSGEQQGEHGVGDTDP